MTPDEPIRALVVGSAAVAESLADAPDIEAEVETDADAAGERLAEGGVDCLVTTGGGPGAGEGPDPDRWDATERDLPVVTVLGPGAEGDSTDGDVAYLGTWEGLDGDLGDRLAARVRDAAGGDGGRRRDDRLEEFASVVSHDLRNPLNVAQSSVELLAAEHGRDAHLERVERSLDRMGAIIDDVTALARLGEPVRQPAQVDLGTMVRDAWAGIEGGTLELADERLTAEGYHRVRADPDRLTALLSNLFENAVVHGGEAVTVTVDATPGGFAVADDGPGLPEGEGDSVFDVGFSTAQEGTGLGLPIAEAVASAHGWTLTVGESAGGGVRLDVEGVTVLER